nr:SURF1 family protein [Limoniibacter endophyticus]
MRIVLGAFTLFTFVVLMALGIWQVQRLFWKLELIERTETRVHAVAAPAPRPVDWPQISRDAHEYLHVELTGTFEHDEEALVQAATERGSGFWVVTPLARNDGTTVLINRGFVPEELRDPSARMEGQVQGEVTIGGLLRLTEPGGGFLRENDPQNDRWFSRDIAAIASARGLEHVAPYFVDADATVNPGGYPIGGMTVIAFRNHHLVYAITWFSLAAMLAGAMIWVVRAERRGNELEPDQR